MRPVEDEIVREQLPYTDPVPRLNSAPKLDDNFARLHIPDYPWSWDIREPVVTGLDVFDNNAEATAIPIRSVAQAAEFCELLAEFYRDLAPPSHTRDAIRFHVPTP